MPRTSRFPLALGAISALLLSYSLMQALLLTAAPTLQRELGTSTNAISWVYTIFFASSAVAGSILGRLGDILGKKLITMVVVAVMLAGCVLAAVADSLLVMIIGRAMQGMGAAVMPLGYALLRDQFPPDKVAYGIGAISSVLAAGGVVGILLTGPIVDHLSHRWLFWLPAVVIVLAGVTMLLAVPESPVRSQTSVNVLAATLLSVGLVAVLLAISYAPKWGWTSGRVLAAAAAGLLVLVAWVRVEARSKVPMIDLTMLRLPTIREANYSAFLIGLSIYGIYVLIPQFAQEPASSGGFGVSTTESALYLMPGLIFQVIGGQVAGPLARRFGLRAMLILGNALPIASYAILTVARSEPWQVGFAAALVGAGVGVLFTVLPRLVVDNIDHGRTGAATGVNIVLRFLGGSIGTQIALTVLASDLGASGRPTAAAYDIAFVLCIVTAVLALLAAMMVPRGRRRAPAPGDV